MRGFVHPADVRLRSGHFPHGRRMDPDAADVLPADGSGRAVIRNTYNPANIMVYSVVNFVRFARFRVRIFFLLHDTQNSSCRVADVGDTLVDRIVLFRHGNSVSDIAVWDGQMDGLSTIRKPGRRTAFVVRRDGGTEGDHSGANILERGDLERNRRMV